ncbi:hypothetical protein OKA04_07265 [Luteolibacter flavescens]|uniref:Uncharacterized protein n=1 Tax=Luteolibacter flavescens TaxID=1859460 RepID=A0ABT3FMP0_9BACT|nr:hypothetical protein [Luteolibacter flavescens]MCW1884526.1 hypothetical protein [Luteolibacter flavescens]
MISLRYTIWRRAFALGPLCLLGGFAGLMFYGEESWSFVFRILIYAGVVVPAIFILVVGILRKLRLLEFTYSEADKNSYLFNQERSHRQMMDSMRGKREE